MNSITFENQMIYGKEYSGKVSYSVPVSSKGWENGHETDEYITKYIPVQFKKGDMPRGEKIRVDMKGFLSTYKDRDGNPQVKFIVTNWQEHIEDSFGA